MHITNSQAYAGRDDPLVDVDTAMLQLREELSAGGRLRTVAALDVLIGEVQRMHEQRDLQRPLFALTPDGERWRVNAANWPTGVLSLEPYRPD